MTVMTTAMNTLRAAAQIGVRIAPVYVGACAFRDIAAIGAKALTQATTAIGTSHYAAMGRDKLKEKSPDWLNKGAAFAYGWSGLERAVKCVSSAGANQNYFMSSERVDAVGKGKGQPAREGLASNAVKGILICAVGLWLCDKVSARPNGLNGILKQFSPVGVDLGLNIATISANALKAFNGARKTFGV